MKNWLKEHKIQFNNILIMYYSSIRIWTECVIWSIWAFLYKTNENCHSLRRESLIGNMRFMYRNISLLRSWYVAYDAIVAEWHMLSSL